MRKPWSLYLMSTLYLLAGINHFVNPAFYLKIIPPYLGDATIINQAAGVAEILLAVLLTIDRTRTFAAYGMILMLLAFLPAHIYMLQQAAAGISPVPGWILWLRLLIIQPLLIFWAWQVGLHQSPKIKKHPVKDAL